MNKKKHVVRLLVITAVISIALFWGRQPADPGSRGATVADSTEAEVLWTRPSAAREVLEGVEVGPDDKFVPGQVLLKFGNIATAAERNAVIRDLGAMVVRTFRHSPQLVLLQLPKGTDVSATVAALATTAAVEAAQANYIYHIDAVPDDPDLDNYWGLDNFGQLGGTPDIDVDAPEAWDLATGSSEIIIGVIDTGVDYTHVDLVANMWSNPGEIAGNGVDDDGNGWVDDIHGIDTHNNDADPQDDHGHGTHVSGTIAAVGNNGIGGAGVLWRASVIGCKFLSEFGGGTDSGAIACLDYFSALKDAGVDVLVTNNSWGGGAHSTLLESAIAEHRDRDILFVAAAGNAGINTDSAAHYPSNYPLDNIISVAAIDRNGDFAYFTNFGATTVDIAAPGVDIYSTIPGNTWRYANGTSMAAPHVVGVVGLLRANDPTLSRVEIVDNIFASAERAPNLEGRVVTGGFLRIDLPFVDDDLDGMPNRWETRYGLNPNNPADAALDNDSDGLTNLEEYLIRSDPLVADTDGDGLLDGAEVNTWGTNPLVADTDQDGLNDGVEVQTHGTDPNSADTDGDGLDDFFEVTTSGTSPLLADTDGDGLPDGWEVQYGFDPLTAGDDTADNDGDGLDNSDEFANGTNPTSADTDGDGLTDPDELAIHGTDPLLADTDGDRMADGWEVLFGLDPLDPTDGPQDLDGDGFSNLLEYRRGTDPTDPASVPPVSPWYTSQANGLRNGQALITTDPSAFAERWSVDTGNWWSYDSTMVVSDWQVIAVERTYPQYDFRLNALSMADGSVNWRSDFVDVSHVQPPYLDGSQVLVPSRSLGASHYMGLYAQDDGAPEGTIDLQAETAHRATVPVDGVLYYALSDEVVAREVSTGDILWSAAPPVSVYPYASSLAVGTDVVALFGMEGLFVWDRGTGGLLLDYRSFNCSGTGFTTVMLDDEGGAFLTRGSCVEKVDIGTGTQVWRRTFTSSLNQWPALGLSGVYVAAYDNLFALSTDTGEMLWERPAFYWTGANLALSLDHLFAATEAGTVAIDLVDGTDVWTHPQQGEMAISDDGALLIYDYYDGLVAINLDGDDDGDGIPNWWERFYRFDYLDPSDAALDADADGLSNLGEFLAGTQPRIADTDEDGLSDGDEANQHGTDPLDADTDDDGLSDGDEVNIWGSDPLLVDTDGDEISDGDEVNYFGTDPTDPASLPELLRSARESFEGGLDIGWSVPAGSAGGWTQSSEDASHGRNSLKSDPVGHYESAAIELRQVFGAGQLSFDLKVDSAQCCSEITVSIDGEPVLVQTRTAWTRQQIMVPAGDHTVRFEFTNLTYNTNPDNQIGRIDNIEYRTLPPFASRAGNLLSMQRQQLVEVEPGRGQLANVREFPTLRRAHELVVTRRHEIVISDPPQMHFYDPVADTLNTVETPDWRVSIGSALATVGDKIFTDDWSSPFGLRVFGLDGQFQERILDGTQYVDLAVGPDGNIHALANGRVIVNIFSPDDYSVVGQATLEFYVDEFTVGSDGSYFGIRYPNLVHKFDAIGTHVATVEAPFESGIHRITTRPDGRIAVGSANSELAFIASDLSSTELISSGRSSWATDALGVIGNDGTDTDGDTLPDWWEILHGLDEADPATALQDGDVDGLDNLAEFAAGTWPDRPDSDFDTISDGDEAAVYGTDSLRYDTDDDALSDAEELFTYGTDPLLADTDGDSLMDSVELLALGTDPLSQDTDGDGMSDGWEVANALDPLDPGDAGVDPDADGLSNLEEFQIGTNVFVADTDRDGLIDGDEVNLHGTNPLLRDSDGDRISDGWEVQYGLDPLSPLDANEDPDGDLYTNLDEFFGNSDPAAASSIPVVDEWVTHQGGPRHSGFIPVRLDPVSFDLLWTIQPFADYQGLLQQVATGDRSLWVSTESYFGYQALASFTEQTGDQNWLHEFGPINEVSAPAFADNRVYVQTGGHQDSFLRAFDADTGDLQFETPFAAQWPTLYAPTPFEGDLFGYAGYYGGIASFSGGAPAINWQNGLDQYDAWSPVVDEQFVYVYSRNGLTVLDRLSGIVDHVIPDPDYDWSGYSGYSSPVMTEFGQLLTPQSRRLLAYDVVDKELMWTVEEPGRFGQPTLLGDRVATIVNDSVLILDLWTGQELWRWNSPEPLKTETVGTVDHLILSSVQTTYILDLETQSEVATFPVGGRLSLSSGGVLFVASQQGELSAIRLAGDRDHDGMPDRWEVEQGYDPTDPADGLGDDDADGLSNADEYAAGSDPGVADTDADGLSDGEEVHTYGSSPRRADTDADGLSDFDEVMLHLSDPTKADTDGDGLSDFDEVMTHGTSPSLADTDGDTFSDANEILLGTDPLDSQDMPSIISSMQESFESGALPPGWSVPGDADAGWEVAEAEAVDGNYRLHSQAVGDLQIAAIEFHGIFSAGYMRFNARISSEPCCDFLRVYVDGNPSTYVSSASWGQYEFVIPDGLHTIRFSYETDYSGAENENKALVDLIEFTADRDFDRMPDDWEILYGLDPDNQFDAGLDNDIDNLPNWREFEVGTSPIDADSDGDGMPDGWEDYHQLAPLADDSDGDPDQDGLTNLREYELGTYPQQSDTDSDGMPDGWEVDNSLDPLVDDSFLDPDGDGVSNLSEYIAGTDPQAAPPPPPPPPPPAPSGGGGGGSFSFFLLLGLALVRFCRKP